MTNSRLQWILLPALFVMICGTAQAADAHRRPGSPTTFLPTSPIGVASAFPRSPLADAFVNGDDRFESEREARARCPDDSIVWVEAGSNFYRSLRVRAGEIRNFGAYMCQADASSEGDRPAIN